MQCCSRPFICPSVQSSSLKRHILRTMVAIEGSYLSMLRFAHDRCSQVYSVAAAVMRPLATSGVANQCIVLSAAIGVRTIRNY